MTKAFPLLVPDGIVYSPAVTPSQQAYSEITRQPLPAPFNHVPNIAYEHVSMYPNILKDSVLTSHLSSSAADFAMLWNGFLNEFYVIITPGQTFEACALFVSTYRPLINRQQLALHLLVLAQVRRLSSFQVMQLLCYYDGEYYIEAPRIPQSYVSFMNEYHIRQNSK